VAISQTVSTQRTRNAFKSAVDRTHDRALGFTRQQIADCHLSAAPLLDHNVAGFYFHSIASQQACVEWLALRMDRQSSVELTTIVVAPCAAALRICAINSYLK